MNWKSVLIVIVIVFNIFTFKVWIHSFLIGSLATVSSSTGWEATALLHPFECRAPKNTFTFQFNSIQINISWKLISKTDWLTLSRVLAPVEDRWLLLALLHVTKSTRQGLGSSKHSLKLIKLKAHLRPFIAIKTANKPTFIAIIVDVKALRLLNTAAVLLLCYWRIVTSIITAVIVSLNLFVDTLSKC